MCQYLLEEEEEVVAQYESSHTQVAPVLVGRLEALFCAEPIQSSMIPLSLGRWGHCTIAYKIRRDAKHLQYVYYSSELRERNDKKILTCRQD
jgi:hypothetical protein